MRAQRLVCSIVGLALVACGSGSGPERVCVPGQSLSCSCPGGAAGVQTCNADGTALGACVCGDCRVVPCPSGLTCLDGQCVDVSCTPQCAGRECGDDQCGGVCGTCGAGFTCSGGVCGLDPGSAWQVAALNGMVAPTTPTGDSWDISGGAPDPYVCLTTNGTQACTAAVIDSYAPNWGGFVIGTASAAQLQAGVALAYYDEDLAVDDVICMGTISFTIDLFREGGSGVTCSDGSYVNLALTPR